MREIKGPMQRVLWDYGEISEPFERASRPTVRTVIIRTNAEKNCSMVNRKEAFEGVSAFPSACTSSNQMLPESGQLRFYCFTFAANICASSLHFSTNMSSSMAAFASPIVHSNRQP